jgi:hypothetical protein
MARNDVRAYIRNDGAPGSTIGSWFGFELAWQHAGHELLLTTLNSSVKLRLTQALVNVTPMIPVGVLFECVQNRRRNAAIVNLSMRLGRDAARTSTLPAACVKFKTDFCYEISGARHHGRTTAGAAGPGTNQGG